MKNLYRQFKCQVQSQHSETNDILRDIYGSQCDLDYNYTHVVSEQPSNQPFEHIDLSIWPAGPPFGLGINTGSIYSTFGLIELGNMYNYGNLLSPKCSSNNDKSYIRFTSSLCYKILQNDVLKVVKSSNLFDLTDATNVIQLKLLSKMHSSIYLRSYNNVVDYQNSNTTQLLDRPIDELFKQIIESTELDIDAKKRRVDDGFIESPQDQLWVNKYRPEYFSDLLSDDKVNREALCWLNSWNNLSNRGDEPRIMILCGPPGVGKSTLVHVIAKHSKYNVVEINASEDRTRDRIMPLIISITTTNSATGKPNLCLLEEIDGLASGEEQVVSALVSLLEEKSKNGGYRVKRPIICTCNDLYNRNLSKLRHIAKILFVHPPDEIVLLERLQSILSTESVVVDPLVLSNLINLYREDIRSCVSSLDYYTRDYRRNKRVKLNMNDLLDTIKDHSSRIDEFIRLVFSLSKDDDSMSVICAKLINILSTGQVNPNFNTMVALLDDHLLKMPYNDPKMTNTSYILDLIAQSDVINRNVIVHPSSSLLIVPYLATLSKIRPLQYSRFSNIVYPPLSIHNISTHRRMVSQNVIKMLQANSIPQFANHIANPSFITDTLSFIMYMIRPREVLTAQDWSDLGKFFKNANIVNEILNVTNSNPAIKQLIHIIRILVVYGINISKIHSNDNIHGEYHLDPDLTLLQMDSWVNSTNTAVNPHAMYDFKHWKIDSSICEALSRAVNWVSNTWLHNTFCISKMGTEISSNMKTAIMESYFKGPKVIPMISTSTKPSLASRSSISVKDEDEYIENIVQPTFKELMGENLDMINHLRSLHFNQTSGKYKYVLENTSAVYHIVNRFQDLFK